MEPCLQNSVPELIRRGSTVASRNRWKPLFSFSGKAFRDMFNFGSRLSVANLINAAFNNIYLLIVGKYFCGNRLGYYTRASLFAGMPSAVLTEVVGRVAFPGH